MLNLFEEHYKFFLSQPVISNSKYCREVTAAYLYVLSDYLLLSRGEHITRQETTQEIFKLLETKILTNGELLRFDKVVDLFGQLIRGEVRVRGDWCFLNDEVSNAIQRVFLCYGDLIYNPDYIEDYENSPIFVNDITDTIALRSQFVKIQELSDNYIKKCNDTFDKLAKVESFDLAELSCKLKEILKPVTIEDNLYEKNIEFCYDNMSLNILMELKKLFEEYLSNYSILMANNGYGIGILRRIADIFVKEGCAHISPTYINGKRISFNPVRNRYIAVLLYERMALLGECEAYLEAARWCSDIRGLHLEERKKKEKEYYNRAAEKGVLEAYRYCDYMPEVFDILIKEKGPKHYIAYFFTYYRRMEYSQCKKYLDFIKQQCTEEEKAEVINEISVNSYEADVLAVKYLNGEIDDYKIKKENHGCYIATCVYGSYDCPEVWTLRRYRDYTLGSMWYGRAFIKLYYAISPTLVKCFGHTKWFKKMWKRKLDKMVEKLQNNGVECSPYQDKGWN